MVISELGNGLEDAKELKMARHHYQLDTIQPFMPKIIHGFWALIQYIDVILPV